MKKIILLILFIFLLGCERGDKSVVKDVNQEASSPVSIENEDDSPPIEEVTDVREFVNSKIEESNELVEQGLSFLQQRDIRKAMQQYWAALDVYPSNTRAYFLLAQLFYYLREYKEVLKILEKAGPLTNAYTFLYKYFLRPELYPEIPEAIGSGRVSIAQFKDNKKCAITFLFCDGSRTFYTMGLPIFEEFGFKATIPIITGNVSDKKSPKNILDAPFGTWDEWKDASQRGFEISNHTIGHRDLNKLPPEELELEINGSYDLMTEKMGESPSTFVFPNESADARGIQKALERHIAVLDRSFLVDLYENIFMPYYGGVYFREAIGKQIVNFAINRRQWLFPICHVINTDELKIKHRPITAEFLRLHLAYIKSKEGEIWVDTFKNVFCYLYERKNSEIHINESKEKSVTFTLTHSLDLNKYFSPLTVIVDTSPFEAKTAKATRKGETQSLPVRIENKKLYIDVIPDPSPVYVEWD